MSWQRAGVGSGGRYTGRDYYDDRRLTEPMVDLPRPTEPVATGRTLQVVGLTVLVAGVAGWLWMILAFVSSIGSGTLPDHPFGTRVAGIPLGTGGLVAIVVGGVLAAIGTWLARTAVSRRARVRVDRNRAM